MMLTRTERRALLVGSTAIPTLVVGIYATEYMHTQPPRADISALVKAIDNHDCNIIIREIGEKLTKDFTGILNIRIHVIRPEKFSRTKNEGVAMSILGIRQDDPTNIVQHTLYDHDLDGFLDAQQLRTVSEPAGSDTPPYPLITSTQLSYAWLVEIVIAHADRCISTEEV